MRAGAVEGIDENKILRELPHSYAEQLAVHMFGSFGGTRQVRVRVCAGLAKTHPTRHSLFFCFVVDSVFSHCCFWAAAETDSC